MRVYFNRLLVSGTREDVRAFFAKAAGMDHPINNIPNSAADVSDLYAYGSTSFSLPVKKAFHYNVNGYPMGFLIPYNDVRWSTLIDLSTGDIRTDEIDEVNSWVNPCPQIIFQQPASYVRPRKVDRYTETPATSMGLVNTYQEGLGTAVNDTSELEGTPPESFLGEGLEQYILECNPQGYPSEPNRYNNINYGRWDKLHDIIHEPYPDGVIPYHLRDHTSMAELREYRGLLTPRPREGAFKLNNLIPYQQYNVTPVHDPLTHRVIRQPSRVGTGLPFDRHSWQRTWWGTPSEIPTYGSFVKPMMYSCMRDTGLDYPISYNSLSGRPMLDPDETFFSSERRPYNMQRTVIDKTFMAHREVEFISYGDPSSRTFGNSINIRILAYLWPNLKFMLSTSELTQQFSTYAHHSTETNPSHFVRDRMLGLSGVSDRAGVWNVMTTEDIVNMDSDSTVIPYGIESLQNLTIKTAHVPLDIRAHNQLRTQNPDRILNDVVSRITLYFPNLDNNRILERNILAFYTKYKEPINAALTLMLPDGEHLSHTGLLTQHKTQNQQDALSAWNKLQLIGMAPHQLFSDYSDMTGDETDYFRENENLFGRYTTQEAWGVADLIPHTRGLHMSRDLNGDNRSELRVHDLLENFKYGNLNRLLFHRMFGRSYGFMPCLRHARQFWFNLEDMLQSLEPVNSGIRLGQRFYRSDNVNTYDNALSYYEETSPSTSSEEDDDEDIPF